MNRRVRRGDGDYTFGANPDGVADPDVPVLLIESPEGKPLAVVFPYACHNTTIRNGHDGFYRYHPDYAGVAARELETRLPGSTAIYVTGAAGEIDTQPQGGLEQAEHHGKTLAAVVLVLSLVEVVAVDFLLVIAGFFFDFFLLLAEVKALELEAPVAF